MDRRLRAVGLVEAAGGVVGKERVDFAGVVEFEIRGAGGRVLAHVHGELQNGVVADEVDDAVAQSEIAVGRVSEFEVEYTGVEGERTSEVARIEDGNGPHRAASAASIAAPTRKTVASLKCLPSTCTPMGRPASVVPHGTLMPQMPASDAATE